MGGEYQASGFVCGSWRAALHTLESIPDPGSLSLPHWRGLVCARRHQHCSL